MEISKLKIKKHINKQFPLAFFDRYISDFAIYTFTLRAEEERPCRVWFEIKIPLKDFEIMFKSTEDVKTLETTDLMKYDFETIKFKIFK